MTTLKRTCAVVGLIGGVVSLTGCGGMSASGSVSPASFFLPGLIQVEESTAPGSTEGREVVSVAPYGTSITLGGQP